MEALVNSAFEREVIRAVTDVVLPFNDVGAGPSFYCVHTLTGTVTEFQHMVRMLGSKQNFYGIQVPTNRRNAEFAKSIKAMSRYYVNELMQFQTKGAFFLGALARRAHRRSARSGRWKWRDGSAQRSVPARSQRLIAHTCFSLSDYFAGRSPK
jgi:hypothetical protein